MCFWISIYWRRTGKNFTKIDSFFFFHTSTKTATFQAFTPGNPALKLALSLDNGPRHPCLYVGFPKKVGLETAYNANTHTSRLHSWQYKSQPAFVNANHETSVTEIIQMPLLELCHFAYSPLQQCRCLPPPRLLLVKLQEFGDSASVLVDYCCTSLLHSSLRYCVCVWSHSLQFIRWSCVLAFSFRYTYSLDHSCGGTNQLEWIDLVYAQTLQVRCRHCQVQQCDLNCVTEHISPVPDLVPSTCTIAAHLLHYWRFWWATWLCIAQVGVVLGLCIRNLATCWMSQRGASYESWHAFFAEQCKIPCINLCSLVFCNLLHSGLWISKALETTMQLLVRFLFFSLVFCTSK